MKYYAQINGRQYGPATVEALVEQGLKPNDYVWTKGMTDWEQAREVADICRYFRIRLHDRLHPSPPATTEQKEKATESAPTDPNEMTYSQLIFHIMSQSDSGKTPSSPSRAPLWLIILAILFFFPLGIAALLQNNRARTMLQQGKNEQAHAAGRHAIVCAGLGICLGVMVFATIIRLL